jgi:hypothetical protein
MAKRSDGGVGARGNHGIAFLGRNKTLVVPIAMSRLECYSCSIGYRSMEGGGSQGHGPSVYIGTFGGKAGSKESGKGDDDMEY